MKARHSALPPNLPPFGASRLEAAALFCVSPTTFDVLVRDGAAPQPKTIRGRLVWSVEELKAAFDRLPRRGQDPSEPVQPPKAGGSSWDAIA